MHVHAFTVRYMYMYYSYVRYVLQLKGKNSRIEELDGEVVSLQGQLDNAASVLNVNVS